MSVGFAAVHARVNTRPLNAAARLRQASVARLVNAAYTNGTVNVRLNGSTATLVGYVDSALDASQLVQVALASDDVSKVINFISIK